MVGSRPFSCFSILFQYCSFQDAHVVDRTVVVVGLHMVDGVDDVEALDDLTKHRVHAIEVGGAANLTVAVAYLRCHLHRAARPLVEFRLHVIELFARVGVAPDNVELGSR